MKLRMTDRCLLPLLQGKGPLRGTSDYPGEFCKTFVGLRPLSPDLAPATRDTAGRVEAPTWMLEPRAVFLYLLFVRHGRIDRDPLTWCAHLVRSLGPHSHRSRSSRTLFCGHPLFHPAGHLQVSFGHLQHPLLGQ